MYKNARELVETELPRAVRSQLFPIFERGVQAYREILSMPGGTFKSIFLHNIKGWMLNFMIFRQFEPDLLSSTFPFISTTEKVNSFEYRALNLLHGNVKINAGKAATLDSFPNRSNYRREYCQRNRFPDDDLFSETDPFYDQLFLSDQPYYLFLTFNVNVQNNKLDFVNLMVPDCNMKKSLFNINLMNEFSLRKKDDTDKKTDEKIVATLKNEFLQNLPIKGEGNE